MIVRMNGKRRDQSVVLLLKAWGSHGSLLEMQNLRPEPHLLDQSLHLTD